MVEPVRHRQTKEAATDMFSLQPPRHISTLPSAAVRGSAAMRRLSEQNLTFGGLDGTVVADPKATFAPPSYAALGVHRGMGISCRARALVLILYNLVLNNCRPLSRRSTRCPDMQDTSRAFSPARFT
jgi:hypothetical protein